MKYINLALIALGLATVSLNAISGSSTGAITVLMVNQADRVLFSAGPHQSKPACSTQADEWATSSATAAGKAMLAVLLSAQAQGKSVQVVGTGACAAWSDREEPQLIIVQ